MDGRGQAAQLEIHELLGGFATPTPTWLTQGARRAQNAGSCGLDGPRGIGMIGRIRRAGRGMARVVASLMLFACASACLAGTQQLAGRLLVVAQDGVAKSGSFYRHYLVLPDGRRYELSVDAQQATLLRTGTILRVNGEMRGKRFQLLPGSAGYAITAPAQPLVATSVRRVATMIVDIEDGQGTTHPTGTSCAEKTIRLMYGGAEIENIDGLDGFMTANSFGALGIAGTNYPGTASDIRSVLVAEPALDIGGVCNEEAWAAAADAQATAAGLNLAAYQHRYYILPPDVGCAWVAQAYQGCSAGSVCRSWVLSRGWSCADYDRLAHAMGHNLGMLHAVTDTNNDGTVDGSDVSDPMESIESFPFREFNAPHRDQMGWPGARLLNVASTGTYTVTAIERQTAATPQILKIAVSNGSPYYLSTRLNEGYDFSMPGTDIFVGRTAVHRYQSNGETRFITSLGDGQSFSDPANGLRLTQLSHGDDGIVAKIEKGVAMNCARSAPTLTVQPSTVTLTAPGGAGFQASLVNKDSADCGPSNFRVVGEAPSGWTASVTSRPPDGPSGPNVVSLLPGASMPFSLFFAPPAGTPNGSYTVKASTATDAMHAAVSAQAAVVINIPPPPCTRNKPIVSMTPTSQTVNAVPASRDYTLTIFNADTPLCSASTFQLTAQVPAKWSTTVTPSTAALSPGAWASAVVKVNVPAMASNGTYNVIAGSATDASHVQSKTVSKLVVALSGGGTCARAAPLVSITPSSQTLTSLPGSASYSVKVTNQDGNTCASSSFALTSSLPAGWSGALTPSSLSLAAGANSTANLIVTAPAGTTNASYSFGAGTAADADHAAVQSGATTIVSVPTGGADTTPPSVPINLKAAVLVNKVKLSWNPSSDAGTGVAGYRVLRNGTLVATTTVAFYNDTPGKGVWSYTVIAFDNAGNASVPSASAIAEVKR